MELESMTVSEVVKRTPEATVVFNRYGIDTCCGGDKAVRVAASLHGVDLDGLLRELAQVGPGTGAQAHAGGECCSGH